MRPTRFIAIDWSGSLGLREQQEHIWIADWSVRGKTLTNGRSRHETIAYLIEAAQTNETLIAGLDFSFSFPAWFVSQQRCTTIIDFWHLVATAGESWLRACKDPFWGRTGCRRPAAHATAATPGFRRTEEILRSKGLHPKSTFQIGGAGAVGTGSIRGIPHLIALREAGFRVWPFDPPGPKTVVEIYPRSFVGQVRVADPLARSTHLQQPQFASVAKEVLARGRASEDAFDALCTVAGMAFHADTLEKLQQTEDPITLLEGEIWTP